MAKKQLEIAISITNQYKNYHVGQITINRFTQALFINTLAQFNNHKKLTISTIGLSQEGRAIKSITFGKGKTKVLLWSQMHGNESTATRAILDILNFITADDKFNAFRSQIAEKLTLQFIPMLNPDGAERFQRRTATQIDMNRDAVALQTPEARLLMKVVDEFKPDFAFNLHDQRRFYNVKGTKVPSSMSFLAPAYNKERGINAPRKKAMQLIVSINKLLQTYIPNGVGLYDDTYSHRSFGDAIQAKGIATILVESGWLTHDMEKEAIRKLNFSAIISAFQMLVENSFNNFSAKDYTTIPSIDTKLFDVLIKNIKISQCNSKVDLGVSRTEHILEHPNYYSIGIINDLGDLSPFYGFETIDAKGLTAVVGKTITIDNLEDISMVSVKRFLKKGMLFMVTTDIPFEKNVPFPINIVHPRRINEVQQIKFESYANFLLIDAKNVVKYIILNGHLINPSNINTSVNGLVLA